MRRALDLRNELLADHRTTLRRIRRFVLDGSLVRRGRGKGGGERGKGEGGGERGEGTGDGGQGRGEEGGARWGREVHGLRMVMVLLVLIVPQTR